MKDADIGTADQIPLICGQFMDVNVFVDFRDVGGTNLFGECCAGSGEEGLVKVVPDIRLFEPWVHAGEWRGHWAACGRSEVRERGRRGVEQDCVVWHEVRGGVVLF